MQAHFESEQAFSISMRQPVFEISIVYEKVCTANLPRFLMKAGIYSNCFFQFFKLLFQSHPQFLSIFF